MSTSAGFLRYLLTGGVSTAVHYITLVGLVSCGSNALLGSVAGSIAGMATNYALTSRWVFSHHGRRKSPLPRFVAVSLLAFLLNALFMSAGLSVGLHYLVAQILSTSALVVINYTLHARWTFLVNGYGR